MSTNWKKIYSLGSCACAVYSFDTANLYRSSIRRLLWQNKHGDERISKQNHVKRDERESKRATQKVRWFVWGLRSVRKKVSVWFPIYRVLQAAKKFVVCFLSFLFHQKHFHSWAVLNSFKVPIFFVLFFRLLYRFFFDCLLLFSAAFVSFRSSISWRATTSSE